MRNAMNEQTEIAGTELTSKDIDHVLQAYAHRFTGDNFPDWAKGKWKGKPYPLNFKDDNEWLANTQFQVRKNGRLDFRFKHCQSSPTWPNNPELRRN